MMLKTALEWTSLLAGILSAFFWLRSSLIQLPVSMAEATIDSVGQLIGLNKNGERVDLYPLLLKQARWSGFGAGLAAAAAACQVAAKWLFP